MERQKLPQNERDWRHLFEIRLRPGRAFEESQANFSNLVVNMGPKMQDRLDTFVDSVSLLIQQGGTPYVLTDSSFLIIAPAPDNNNAKVFIRAQVTQQEDMSLVYEQQEVPLVESKAQHALTLPSDEERKNLSIKDQDACKFFESLFGSPTITAGHTLEGLPLITRPAREGLSDYGEHTAIAFGASPLVQCAKLYEEIFKLYKMHERPHASDGALKNFQKNSLSMLGLTSFLQLSRAGITFDV